MNERSGDTVAWGNIDKMPNYKLHSEGASIESGHHSTRTTVGSGENSRHVWSGIAVCVNLTQYMNNAWEKRREVYCTPGRSIQQIQKGGGKGGGMGSEPGGFWFQSESGSGLRGGEGTAGRSIGSSMPSSGRATAAASCASRLQMVVVIVVVVLLLLLLLLLTRTFSTELMHKQLCPYDKYVKPKASMTDFRVKLLGKVAMLICYRFTTKSVRY